jgi:mRNA interferase MazF
MPPFGDWLICGVSTQLQQRVPNFDEVIAPADPDFSETGLKATSIIRLGFLTTVSARSILGVIGAIAPERHQRLLERLARLLRLEGVTLP